MSILCGNIFRPRKWNTGENFYHNIFKGTSAWKFPLRTAAPAEISSEWILQQRGPKNRVDPTRAHACLVEDEFSPEKSLARTATLFLTNRECPLRCLMCDLWKNTLEESQDLPDIPLQIRTALNELHSRGPFAQIKLYNSGSFFDPNAIPIPQYERIAQSLGSEVQRVVVESHPAFIGSRTKKFQQLLSARLQVAIGLETCHPEVLERLNKKMTLDAFSRAAEFLLLNGMELRVFILLRPPFLNELEAVEWACRSIDFAFANGASVVTVIPTRLGNGAMEKLAQRRAFEQPTLASLEKVVSHGLSLRKGIVFSDLWDLGKFRTCPHCFEARSNNLELGNRLQTPMTVTPCPACDSHDA
jgi:radical SAM enzyme (TIGR01210 family)